MFEIHEKTLRTYLQKKLPLAFLPYSPTHICEIAWSQKGKQQPLFSHGKKPAKSGYIFSKN
jgi:hypothetical protein